MAWKLPIVTVIFAGTAVATATTAFADDAPPAATSTWTTSSPVTTTSVSTTATAATTTTTTTTAADVDLTAPPPPPPPPAPQTPAMVAPRESVTVYDRQYPHKALFITGASAFVTTYALTATFAGLGQRASDRDLFVPFAGPVMNLANRNCARDCVSDSRDTALLVTSAVFQNIGGALMIASAFIPNKVAVGQITAGPVKMQIAPTAGASTGLGAIGAF